MTKTGPKRRLLAILAALALAAGPLAAGGAWAKDHGGPGGERHGGGQGRWGGGERGGERGGPQGWRGGGDPRGGEPRGGRWGGEGPGGGRWAPDPRAYPRYEQRQPDPRAYEGRGYESRGYAPAPRAHAPPRRGGYLGPQGGAPIEDPGRYRLREAPRGYMWMRVPGGMALVSQATGQVFDVVPDR